MFLFCSDNILDSPHENDSGHDASIIFIGSKTTFSDTAFPIKGVDFGKDLCYNRFGAKKVLPHRAVRGIFGYAKNSLLFNFQTPAAVGQGALNHSLFG